MNSGPAAIYRAQILKAVADIGPRDVYRVADSEALDRICANLVQAEEARSILRAKAYGAPWLSIVDIVASLPDKSHEQHQTTKGAQTRSKG